MWLGSCDVKDGYCEQCGCLLYLVVAESLRAIPVLFGNKVRCFEFSVLGASEKECPNVQ
jgi:hypothetical protein